MERNKKPPLVFDGSVGKFELLRRIFLTSLPVILSNLLYTFQNAVSLFLIAPLGAAAIAGVGFGSTFLWVVYASMAAVYTGVNVSVAKEVGGGKRAGRFLTLGVLLSAVTALPLVFWGDSLFKGFLNLFTNDMGVVENASLYLKPIFLLLPFAFITNALNAAFNGLGKTEVIFYATVFTTAANLSLSYLLIFGKLGLPKLGVEGAGWGVALAESFAALIYLPFLLKSPEINPLSDKRIALREIFEFLKLGIPTGVERVAMSLSYNIFVGLVAVCGTAVLAAFQIGLRVESLSFTVGMAFAFVATTVAGQNLGAENPEGLKRGIKTLWGLAASVMSTLGVLIALFSKPLAGIFTDNPEVLSYSVQYLTLVALSQPLMATVFVLSGTIRGLGKTQIPLLVNISLFWLVRLFPSMFLLKFVKSPFVPWGFMLSENLVRSSVYVLLFRRILKDLTPLDVKAVKEPQVDGGSRKGFDQKGKGI